MVASLLGELKENHARLEIVLEEALTKLLAKKVTIAENSAALDVFRKRGALDRIEEFRSFNPNILLLGRMDKSDIDTLRAGLVEAITRCAQADDGIRDAAVKEQYDAAHDKGEWVKGVVDRIIQRASYLDVRETRDKIADGVCRGLRKLLPSLENRDIDAFRVSFREHMNGVVDGRSATGIAVQNLVKRKVEGNEALVALVSDLGEHRDKIRFAETGDREYFNRLWEKSLELQGNMGVKMVKDAVEGPPCDKQVFLQNLLDKGGRKAFAELADPSAGVWSR